MRPLSRRTRYLLIALAGAAAMLAGALPVLVSSGGPSTPGVTVQAGSVDTTGPESAIGPIAVPPASAATPSTTSPVPSAQPSVPATAGPATNGIPQACRAQDLAMNAGTDRTTYRPGDVITVTATVTNQSDGPCWVTDLGASSNAISCDPQVLLQRYDGTDGYNAVLGPYHAQCGPDQTVLAAGESTTSQVQTQFTAPQDCGPDPGAAACQLRAGSWTAVVSWLTGGSAAGDSGMSAELPFYCPPDACSPEPASQTTNSTTATTGSSTSSTTAPSPTSTTAAPAHKSSTTTSTSKSTSTTTRRANRRAGG